MRSTCHHHHVRVHRIWTHTVSSLCALCFVSSLSLSLLCHSLSTSLSRWPGFWELRETGRVFDWGGDAITVSRTGLALFSSSSSLLCFRRAHLPGFPLLMEFLKHGIMRGVNQDRENRQFSEILGGRQYKGDLQKGPFFERVSHNACLPHILSTWS